MADAASMLSGINSHWFVVAFALLISWATIRLEYRQIANVLKWLVLVLFAYPITAFVVGADWSQVLRDTLIPSCRTPEMNGRRWWRSSAPQSVPISFSGRRAKKLKRRSRQAKVRSRCAEGPHPKELELRNIDVGVGAFFSNMVMFFIILTTAITLNRHGITNIETSRQAAEALRPFAGNFAATLFTLGIVGVGFLAIPTLAGSTAYAFAETLGWRQGLNKKLRQARWFYALILVSTAVGCRAGFYRDQSGKGALLDSGHQRIAGAVSPGRNPDCGSGQEADAGPAEFPPGMDCCGNYDDGHVCRRHCNVCGVSRATKRLQNCCTVA